MTKINDTLYEYTFADDPFIETLMAVFRSDSAHITITIEEAYPDGWIYYEQWSMDGIADSDSIIGVYELEALYRLFGNLCEMGYTEEDNCRGSGTFKITRKIFD